MKNSKHPFLYALIRRAIVLVLLILMGLTIYQQSSGAFVSPEGALSKLIIPVQSVVTCIA